MEQATFNFTDEAFADTMTLIKLVKPVPKKDGVATKTDMEHLRQVVIDAIEKMAVKGARRQRLVDEPIDYTKINNIISNL